MWDRGQRIIIGDYPRQNLADARPNQELMPLFGPFVTVYFMNFEAKFCVLFHHAFVVYPDVFFNF
jgi:hypothetical protein